MATEFSIELDARNETDGIPIGAVWFGLLHTYRGETLKAPRVQPESVEGQMDGTLRLVVQWEHLQHGACDSIGMYEGPKGGTPSMVIPIPGGSIDIYPSTAIRVHLQKHPNERHLRVADGRVDRSFQPASHIEERKSKATATPLVWEEYPIEEEPPIGWTATLGQVIAAGATPPQSKPLAALLLPAPEPPPVAMAMKDWVLAGPEKRSFKSEYQGEFAPGHEAPPARPPAAPLAGYPAAHSPPHPQPLGRTVEPPKATGMGPVKEHLPGFTLEIGPILGWPPGLER